MSKLEIEKFCEIINGKYPTQKTKPGKYPLVVTAKERKSSETYQINAKAICIPKVSCIIFCPIPIKDLLICNS